MVFHVHMALSLELLALVAGMMLLAKACSTEICCKLFYKVVAYFVIVVSILSILCTAWHGIAAWRYGSFCMRHMGAMGEMMGPGMQGPGMGGMMAPGMMGPMHQKMMQQMGEPSAPPAKP